MNENYLVIFVCVLAGALCSLASANTKSHRDALKLLARIVGVVAGLGYIGGHLVNKYIGVMYPWDVATAAFILAATAEYHPKIITGVIDKFLKKEI